MILPENFETINDLSIISSYSYDSNYYYHEIIHIPFLIWLVFSIIIIIIFERIILEMLIRLRK